MDLFLFLWILSFVMMVVCIIIGTILRDKVEEIDWLIKQDEKFLNKNAEEILNLELKKNRLLHKKEVGYKLECELVEIEIEALQKDINKSKDETAILRSEYKKKLKANHITVILFLVMLALGITSMILWITNQI